MLNNYDAQQRKDRPVYTGVLKYFPNALLEVANLSRVGNEQHNPGQPLHWAKEKSQDEADALVRHLLDAGTFDTDGQRHSTKVAWRALALLERELEAEAKDRETLKSWPINEGFISGGSVGRIESELEAYEAYAAPDRYTHAEWKTEVAGTFVDTDHSADNGELPKPPMTAEPNTEGTFDPRDNARYLYK